MIFEEIYQTYWPRVFRLCMGYTNDYSLAQDMAQETFLVVWKALPQFRGEANIETWIFRIATNNCLRYIEKEAHFPKAEFPVHEVGEEQPTDTEWKIRQLYTYISALPEIERIIISLALEGVKQSDIADVVGLSNTNVRVKIHRIKEKLACKFKENE